MPNGCVALRLKMLTYYHVCCAFSPSRALPLNIIWGFETASKIKPLLRALRGEENIIKISRGENVG